MLLPPPSSTDPLFYNPLSVWSRVDTASCWCVPGWAIKQCNMPAAMTECWRLVGGGAIARGCAQCGRPEDMKRRHAEGPKAGSSMSEKHIES